MTVRDNKSHAVTSVQTVQLNTRCEKSDLRTNDCRYLQRKGRQLTGLNKCDVIPSETGLPCKLNNRCEKQRIFWKDDLVKTLSKKGVGGGGATEVAFPKLSFSCCISLIKTGFWKVACAECTSFQEPELRCNGQHNISRVVFTEILLDLNEYFCATSLNTLAR